jgi:hypothetical protein
MSPLPVSESQLANLVAEMALQLGEGDCELDLRDLDLMKHENETQKQQQEEPKSDGAGGGALVFQSVKQCLMALQLLNVDFVSSSEFESSCLRAGFSPAVTAFLTRHSRAAAGWRLLSRAQAMGAPAAKYAVLETELRKQEDEEMLEEEEEQQLMRSSYGDDEVAVVRGGGGRAAPAQQQQVVLAQSSNMVEEDFSSQMFSSNADAVADGQAAVQYGNGAATGSDRRAKTVAFATHELSLSDESAVDGPIALSPRFGGGGGGGQQRLTLAELAARLAVSKLVEDGGSSLLLSSSPTASSQALSEQLASLDRELALKDLEALEAQGGLKFRSGRQLVAALALVQEHGGYDAADEIFAAELERRAAADKFSPSVAQFLWLLHRSPARQDRLKIVRSQTNRRRGGGGGGGGSSARFSSVTMLQNNGSSSDDMMIREEGEDSELAGSEEAVVVGQPVTAGSLARCIRTLAPSLFVTDGDELVVEESQVQELLLHRSDLCALPEAVIEADLAALASQGARVRHTRDLVHVLQLIHSRPDKQIDQDEVQLLFPSDSASSNAPQPKHVAFLLQYRAQSEALGRNRRVTVQRGAGGSVARRAARKQVALLSTQRPFDEAEFAVEEFDDPQAGGGDAASNGSVVAHRRAQALARALRQSTLLDVSEAGASDEGALVEQLERHVLSMDFALGPGHFEALQALEAESRALQQQQGGSVSASQRAGLKPIVLALQLLNEADTLALDRVAVEARAAALPQPLAQFVLVRSNHEAQLSQCMSRRRREAAAAANAAARRRSAAAAASAVPTATALTIPEEEQALTVELLEQELHELVMSDESVQAAAISDDPASSRAQGVAALRQACVEMELDLSEITLQELRVLRAAPTWRRVTSPRQAVQILALSRFDAAQGLTKARVRGELERRLLAHAQQAGGAGVVPQQARSEAQQHATVQLLFDLEEELMMEEVEEGFASDGDDAASAERHVSVSRVSSPAGSRGIGSGGPLTVVASLPSSSETSPDPAGVLSPAPPPFPEQLRATSLGGGSSVAGSPPLPPFPHVASDGAASSSSSSSSPPPPPPAVHPLPRGLSESVAHVRFHSNEDSALAMAMAVRSPPHGSLQQPSETQLAALVDQINTHNLCKSRAFSGPSELPMSLSELSFVHLHAQVEQLAVRALERNLRDKPVFESPAHCIRCLYADVLPAALDPAIAPTSSAAAAVAASPRSASSMGSSEGDEESDMLPALAQPQAQQTGHRRGDKNASQTEQQLIEQHIQHIRGSMILQPGSHRGSKVSSALSLPGTDDAKLVFRDACSALCVAG